MNHLQDLERIAAIKKRCEAATAGPWYQGFMDNDGEGPIPPEPDGNIYTASPRWCDQRICSYQMDDDADFIVHAREDIPFLLEECEQVQKENQRLRAEAEALADALHNASMKQVDLMAQIDSGVEVYGKDTADLRREIERLRKERDAAAEVVDSLVFCYQCKHYDGTMCQHKHWEIEGMAVGVQPDDLCSYGERRGLDDGEGKEVPADG